MPAGLFGKLPARRDFVAAGVSRGFLDVWENWAPAALIASREKLGAGWEEAFLGAPIWRFWLGPGLCGTCVLGASMPSLDGVGRYYPLTIVREGAAPPPEIDLQEAWFDAAETFLLATLGDDASYEQFIVDLDSMPEPASDGILGSTPSSGGYKRLGAAPASETFDELRRSHWRVLNAHNSFWWTIGGATHAPAALACSGMPPPPLFSSMLTGEFCL
jgi:type VI secretion system protein ImpM